jgi:hypothetical protein
MHPRTREILTYFDDHRAILKSAFDSVPPERRNKPPEPGRWSTANVVEHLSIVETRMAGILSSRIREEREAGLAGETSAEPVLPNLDVVRVSDRTTRVQAPDFAFRPGWKRPLHGLSWKSPAALRAMLLSGDGLALPT